MSLKVGSLGNKIDKPNFTEQVRFSKIFNNKKEKRNNMRQKVEMWLPGAGGGANGEGSVKDTEFHLQDE